MRVNESLAVDLDRKLVEPDDKIIVIVRSNIMPRGSS